MLRFDRQLSLCWQRYLRLTPSGREFRIPILMYHGIRECTFRRQPYYETNTSPAVFTAQMRYLCDNGYQAVHLDTALSCLTLDSSKSRKFVVITFDDGYSDFYTYAYPVLQGNGMLATVFIISSLCGYGRVYSHGSQYLSWADIREVHAGGIRIGSHTATHPKLGLVDWPRVEDEIRCSKETIEDRLGAAVESFAHPYAFPEADAQYTSRLRTALARHGYQNGVTTIIGTARIESDRFLLPRLPVNSWDDMDLFRAKLEGAYDWLHGPQYMFKRLRGMSGEVFTAKMA
jgi:peptidoglycan/xylan/chitin deacetylase (PgdA/CDA1 family)